MSLIQGLLDKRRAQTQAQPQVPAPRALPADEGLASLLLEEDQDKIVPQFTNPRTQDRGYTNGR